MVYTLLTLRVFIFKFSILKSGKLKSVALNRGQNTLRSFAQFLPS